MSVPQRSARRFQHFKPTWPTRLGAIFIGLIFLVGALAISYSNNLHYMVVAMLLAFQTLSGLLAEYSLMDIDATLSIPDEIYARSAASLGLELTNNKPRFPLIAATVRDDGAFGVDRVRVLHLPGGDTLRVRFLRVFPHRGWHAFEGIWLATRFPFCFWEKAALIPGPQKFLVFPQPLDPPDLPVFRGARDGTVEQSVKGFGPTVVSLRDYVPGDSASRIHWGRSARSETLQVKETERESDHSVVILVAGGLGPTLESAVSMATGIVLWAEREGLRAALVTHRGFRSAGAGAAHRRSLLTVLAELDDSPPGWKPDPRLLELGTVVCVARAGAVPADVMGPDSHVLLVGDPVQ